MTAVETIRNYIFVYCIAFYLTLKNEEALIQLYFFLLFIGPWVTNRITMLSKFDTDFMLGRVTILVYTIDTQHNSTNFTAD